MLKGKTLSAFFVLAIALAVAIWKKRGTNVPGPSILNIKRDIQVFVENTSRLPPLTYRADGSSVAFDASYSHLASRSWTDASKEPPDTTAVVLNWSRFPNVQRIASLLCSPDLEHVIKEVFIWNNNPTPIFYSDFRNTTCSESKLRIYNSPENTYFYGRFLACEQANTTFCFTQDDDYLVLPEIIQTMHRTLLSSPPKSHYSIHLLPPHEHLTTTLRTIEHTRNDMHTTFAWLGHGAMMHRSRVVEFLETMEFLNATKEEKQMSDNYFSVLQGSGKPPQTWVDQGIELGGGHAFTVGTEGDERNRRHIRRAGQYLDLMEDCDMRSIRDPTIKCPSYPMGASPGSGYPDDPIGDAAFTDAGGWLCYPHATNIVNRSPCYGRPCLFETTIPTLPGDPVVEHTAKNAEGMLELEENNRKRLGAKVEERYLNYSAKYAVDGRPETGFSSFGHAKKFDAVILDLLVDVSKSWELSETEMVWLVDDATEAILRSCIFESSSDEDGYTWTQTPTEVICFDVDPSSLCPSAETVSGEREEREDTGLKECSVRMSDKASPEQHPRRFRARLMEDLIEEWSINEVWVRGKLRQGADVV